VALVYDHHDQRAVGRGAGVPELGCPPVGSQPGRACPHKPPQLSEELVGVVEIVARSGETPGSEKAVVAVVGIRDLAVEDGDLDGRMGGELAQPPPLSRYSFVLVLASSWRVERTMTT
jgi:hypothetical protein